MMGSSQWYTKDLSINSTPKAITTVSDPVSPSAIFELRQEVCHFCKFIILINKYTNFYKKFQLTSSRPLRSEVEREKRISQRQSIQSETNSNRNSAGS